MERWGEQREAGSSPYARSQEDAAHDQHQHLSILRVVRFSHWCERKSVTNLVHFSSKEIPYLRRIDIGAWKGPGWTHLDASTIFIHLFSKSPPLPLIVSSFTAPCFFSLGRQISPESI